MYQLLPVDVQFCNLLIIKLGNVPLHGIQTLAPQNSGRWPSKRDDHWRDGRLVGDLYIDNRIHRLPKFIGD